MARCEIYHFLPSPSPLLFGTARPLPSNLEWPMSLGAECGHSLTDSLYRRTDGHIIKWDGYSVLLEIPWAKKPGTLVSRFRTLSLSVSVLMFSMATEVKDGSDIIFYGTIVIPAYVEKYVSDALNFSKPRLTKLVVMRNVKIWSGVLLGYGAGASVP